MRPLRRPRRLRAPGSIPAKSYEKRVREPLGPGDSETLPGGPERVCQRLRFWGLPRKGRPGLFFGGDLRKQLLLKRQPHLPCRSPLQELIDVDSEVVFELASYILQVSSPLLTIRGRRGVRLCMHGQWPRPQARSVAMSTCTVSGHVHRPGVSLIVFSHDRERASRDNTLWQ